MYVQTVCLYFYIVTGHINGVAKELCDSFPKVVAMVYAAHTLALAGKDASQEVKYIATFRDHLQQHHNVNRITALKQAKATLGLTDLKMKVYICFSWSFIINVDPTLI